MPTDKVQIIVELEGRQVKAEVTGLENALANMGKAGQQAGSVGARGMSTLAESAQRAGASMRESLFGAVLGANMLGSALTGLVDKLKDLTIGSVLYAAKTDMLDVAMMQMAKTAGIASINIRETEKTLTGMRISVQEAKSAIVQFIRAGLPLEKLPEMARKAQSLAVIASATGPETVSSGQALQRWIQAIVTGQTELLHHLGLMTTFEKVQQKVRTSTEGVTTASEQQRVRLAMLGETLKEASGYNGVYEESMKTVGKQLSSLLTDIENAQQAFGELYQKYLYQVVKTLREMAEEVAKDPEKYATWIESLALATAGFGLLKIGIDATTTALQRFALAFEVGRFFLELSRNIKAEWEGWQARFEAVDLAGRLAKKNRDAFKSEAEILQQSGENWEQYVDRINRTVAASEQIKATIRAFITSPSAPGPAAGKPAPVPFDPAQLKTLVRLREEIEAIGRIPLTGLAKQFEDIDAKVRKIAEDAKEHGLLGTGLVAAAQAAAQKAKNDLWLRENKKFQQEAEKDWFKDQNKIFDEGQKGLDRYNNQVLSDLKKRVDAGNQIEDLGIRERIAMAGSERERLDIENGKRLADYAKTIAELKDADVLYKAFKLHLAETTNAELDRQARDRAQGLRDEIAGLQAATAYGGRNQSLNAYLELATRQQIELNKYRREGWATDLLEQKHQLEMIQLQESQYRKLYDNVYEQAGHVWDAIFEKGKGGWKGLLDYIKGIWQTYMRMLFSEFVASLLTPVMSGLRAAFGGGMGGGGRATGGGWGNILGGIFGRGSRWRI